MELHDTRRRRVRQIIEEQFGGVDAKFAARIERSPAQVARWFMDNEHKRDIGEKLARHIERATAQPQGSLDTDVQNGAPVVQQPLGVYNIPPAMQAVVLDLFDHLSEEQQAELLDELKAKKLSNEAIFKKWDIKMKHVTRARAAEKLPAAPKPKAKV